MSWARGRCGALALFGSLGTGRALQHLVRQMNGREQEAATLTPATTKALAARKRPRVDQKLDRELTLGVEFDGDVEETEELTAEAELALVKSLFRRKDQPGGEQL